MLPAIKRNSARILRLLVQATQARTARKKKSQQVLDRFNQAVFTHQCLESFIVPVGHGLTIARKKISKRY